MIGAGWVLGIAGLAIAGLGVWVWVERTEGAGLRERAVSAELQASDARAAAAANAASADWHRQAAAAAGRRGAEVQGQEGKIQVQVVYREREVYRASDAYSPARASLRAALEQLRALNATGPGAPGPDPASQARSAAGDPAQAGAARPVAARPGAPATEGAIGAYCVRLLGHVIVLEERLAALGRWWDDLEKEEAATRR